MTPSSFNWRTTSHISLRSSTSTPAGGLVEEQHPRLVAQRLGDQHPALHAARQLHGLGVLLVPQRQFLENALENGRVVALAEQAAGEAQRVIDRLERLERDFLRHQPDQRAGLAEILDDIEAADPDRPGTGIDQPADDRDQRRLARAIRPQQSQDLSFLDLQIDTFQRLKAAVITFGKMIDRDNGRHDLLFVKGARPTARDSPCAKKGGSEVKTVVGPI